MSNSVTGILEMTGNSGGYLRPVQGNYRASSSDVAVPSTLCRSLGLRGGEAIVGTAGHVNGKRNARSASLVGVDTINEMRPADYLERKPFEELTPVDPREALRFESPGGSISMRVLDLLTPIGLGQRGLIVAPPRTGKTVLLQQMAAGVAANFPHIYMMVLLIDERPEEVTDMRRNVSGEVVASSNDQDTVSHMRLAKLMIEKAKRMVECGRDVVILLDSLTRLGRAFNVGQRGTGRTMSGGLDARALIEPKGIFGAARNIEDGGSLTIIASALIETGSRMDEVIFNEFKGTGNMEIMLSRDMANRRTWPAIDLQASGTRKEELLLSPAELEVSHRIRRSVLEKDPSRSMEQLLDQLGRYPDNKAFVASVATGTGR